MWGHIWCWISWWEFHWQATLALLRRTRRGQEVASIPLRLRDHVHNVFLSTSAVTSLGSTAAWDCLPKDRCIIDLSDLCLSEKVQCKVPLDSKLSSGLPLATRRFGIMRTLDRNLSNTRIASVTCQIMMAASMISKVSSLISLLTTPAEAVSPQHPDDNNDRVDDDDDLEASNEDDPSLFPFTPSFLDLSTLELKKKVPKRLPFSLLLRQEYNDISELIKKESQTAKVR